MKAHDPRSAISRRRFLKAAGVGSATLASLPTLALTTGMPAWAEDRTNFHFDCQGKGPTVVDAVAHRLAMAGEGTFHGPEVVGSGSFIHFNGLATLPTPKPLLASGTWKATRLISFAPHGTYGVFEAGIARFEIELIRLIPSRAVIPATIKVVCSIGAGGPATDTGEEEGITLEVDGLTFEPLAGLTVFTTVVETRD